jgi:hypothetical protein
MCGGAARGRDGVGRAPRYPNGSPAPQTEIPLFYRFDALGEWRAMRAGYGNDSAPEFLTGAENAETCRHSNPKGPNHACLAKAP